MVPNGTYVGAVAPQRHHNPNTEIAGFMPNAHLSNISDQKEGDGDSDERFNNDVSLARTCKASVTITLKDLTRKWLH